MYILNIEQTNGIGSTWFEETFKTFKEMSAEAESLKKVQGIKKGIYTIYTMTIRYDYPSGKHFTWKSR